MMDDHASTNRRLAAILAADISGYSRLMGEDEAATVRDLKAHQAVVLPLVGRYGGRIIDTAGDASRSRGRWRPRFRRQTARSMSPRCSLG
jgi:adenylate cyclase